MSVSKYLCFIVGEKFEKAQKLHSSSQKRLTAFALAIHIPVLLWAVTGYVISSSIFHLEQSLSTGIAFFCALSIYLVERIVLATPKNFLVNVIRLMIGLVIAVLGASTVDLVIFDREIAEQLHINAQERIQQDHVKKTASIVESIDLKKAEWQRAKEAANCEANGTCGSRLRSVGPVYRELARQADMLRKDYLREQMKYDSLTEKMNSQLDEARASSHTATQAGLLSRIKALHDYTSNNFAAFVAWSLFLCLVLFFELMVVIAKLVFAETVDDELDRIRETISQVKARAYKEAITSPVYSAREMVNSAYA
jgi:hypothetical protein